MKSNITFLLFTFNEEKRISYPIKCFLPYGEVIVADNLSTDKTPKIAEKLGARVLRFRRDEPFCETKEVADYLYKFVKTDWVFWGFADEMIPIACLNLYQEIVKEGKYKIVVQKRKTLLFDPRHEFYSTDVAIKFFRKDAIDFTSNKIHQSGKFASHVRPSEILYLLPLDEYSVYHFSIYTTETQINNLQKYYQEEAEGINKKITPVKLILGPIQSFAQVYFLSGAIWQGIYGFIAAMHAMIFSFMVTTRAYERQNNINYDSIEKKFAVSKKIMLQTSPHSNLLKKLWATMKIMVISRLHKRYKFSR